MPPPPKAENDQCGSLTFYTNRSPRFCAEASGPASEPNLRSPRPRIIRTAEALTGRAFFLDCWSALTLVLLLERAVSAVIRRGRLPGRPQKQRSPKVSGTQSFIKATSQCMVTFDSPFQKDRGLADFGCWASRVGIKRFSFGGDYHDPVHMGFRVPPLTRHQTKTRPRLQGFGEHASHRDRGIGFVGP